MTQMLNYLRSKEFNESVQRYISFSYHTYCICTTCITCSMHIYLYIYDSQSIIAGNKLVEANHVIACHSCFLEKCFEENLIWDLSVAIFSEEVLQLSIWNLQGKNFE